MAKIVIIGATSGIAEHCARLWAAQGGSDMVLVGRDATRLDPIAADLTVRGASAQVLAHDDLTPQGCASLVAQACAGGVPQIVLIAQGQLPNQTACQNDLGQLAQALLVNGTSVCMLAEGFAAQMQDGPARQLILLGSVAGDRGRKSNYAYGAAKGLVARYAQGMQHRLALEKSALRVTLVKPGPTATAMTAHLPQEKLADPAKVAAQIVAAKKRAVLYTPSKWALIMQVLRHIPAVLFNKVDI